MKLIIAIASAAGPPTKPEHLSAAWQSSDRMLNGLISLLPNIAMAIVVFALFVIGGRIAQYVVKHVAERRRVRQNVIILMGKSTQLIFVFAGILCAIPVVSSTFNLGTLMTTLGISSVAIGFAFKDVLENFLAGILLLLHEPFQIGDRISVSGFEGVVDQIKVRSTIIRMQDGRHAVIPSSTVFQNPVVVQDEGAPSPPQQNTQDQIHKLSA